MFRPPPPRGRVRRLSLAAMLLGSLAVVALPAAAAERPTEAPTEVATEVATEVPSEVAFLVEGRDPLTLPPAASGVPVTVTLTDVRGEAAVWNLEPRDDATPYAVDLDAPAEGEPPVNGTFALVVTSGGAELLAGSVVVDRDPPAPALAAGVRDGDVFLVWNPVRAAGEVHYRLQRARANGTWATLVDAVGVVRHTDADPGVGRQRYRVSAAMPGVARASNFSSLSTVTVRVAPAPAEPARPSPPPVTGAPAIPDLPRTPQAEPKPDARRVAVTGDIRRGVPAPRPRVAETPRVSPGGPTLQPLRWRPHVRQQVAPGPDLAPPRASDAEPPVVAQPLDRFPQEPVAIPPSGTLAVEVARGAALPHVDLGTGLSVAAAAALLLEIARRRRRQLTLVPDGLR